MATAIHAQLTPDEVVERGKRIYQDRLRPQVSEGNLGKYLVIDVLSGEYEMGETHLDTAKRARAKHPDAPLYGMRIGYPATDAIGATLRPTQENKIQEKKNA